MPRIDRQPFARSAGVRLRGVRLSVADDPQARREKLARTVLDEISRSIIDAHGGSLWATRNDAPPDETFRFSLPAAPTGPA